MRPEQRVNTPEGPGIIKGTEVYYKRKYFLVLLDNNPFGDNQLRRYKSNEMFPEMEKTAAIIKRK